MKKLKPCPFCGSKYVDANYNWHSYFEKDLEYVVLKFEIECADCQICVADTYKDKGEDLSLYEEDFNKSINKWNKRSKII